MFTLKILMMEVLANRNMLLLLIVIVCRLVLAIGWCLTQLKPTNLLTIPLLTYMWNRAAGIAAAPVR